VDRKGLECMLANGERATDKYEPGKSSRTPGSGKRRRGRQGIINVQAERGTKMWKGWDLHIYCQMSVAGGVVRRGFTKRIHQGEAASERTIGARDT